MAATVYKARVWETAAVTGTSTVSLTGAAQPGYRAFSSCVPSGSLVAYCIYDATAQAWETGIGTFTITTAPAGTLTRGLSESSTGSLISFAGNSCDVTLDMISPVQVSAGAASAGLIPALNAAGQLDSSMGGGTIAITDGTNTLTQMEALKVNNLGLTIALAPVVVVQSAGYGASAPFAKTPTSGNLLVAIIESQSNFVTPSGWTLQESFSIGGINCGLFTQISTGVQPSVWPGLNGPNWMWEITNGGAFTAFKGSISITGSAASFAVPPGAGLVLAGFLTLPDQNPPSLSSPVPSTASILVAVQGPYGSASAIIYESANTGTSGTIGFTDPGITSGQVVGIFLPGAGTGDSASITPSIPVMINGTAEGDFQSLVVTTGNTTTSASLSGSVLTLNI